jgi:signal transduction histidine kinase
LSIQAFEAIFDNAIKYVNEGGIIDVLLKHGKRGIICAVGNSGAGIEKDDILKIFDRFFRADRSRSSETGGFGLGLSIAKTIMDKLGGKISAVSAHGWTEFTLIWNA